MSKNDGHPRSFTVGIVGGKASIADRLGDSMVALGYHVAFTLPDERALRKHPPLKADAVILLRPARSNHSVGLAIDGTGVVRTGQPAQTDHPTGKSGPQLTNREKQALSMVVMGLTNQQIADKLFVSESTVKSHLNSAYRKLGVHTRVEAARLITDPSKGLGTGILAITRSGLGGDGNGK